MNRIKPTSKYNVLFCCMTKLKGHFSISSTEKSIEESRWGTAEYIFFEKRGILALRAEGQGCPTPTATSAGDGYSGSSFSEI